MIVRELREDGRFLVTRSDSGFMVRKVNPADPEREEVYSEAWDLVDTHYVYEETDVPAEEDEEEVAEEDIIE